MRFVITSVLFTSLMVALVGCQKDEAKPISAPVCAVGEDMGPGIIGGKLLKKEGRIGQSVVALISGEKNEEQLCTATLIAPNVVLTAAHCLYNDHNHYIPEGSVVFGNDLVCEYVEKNDQTKIKKFEEVIVHSKYNNRKPTVGYDIALIKFKGGLPDGYKTLSLVKSIDEVDINRNVFLAGFGKTTEYDVKDTTKPMLRFATVRPAKKIGDTELKISAEDLQLVFDQSQGESACAGDSGGPALIEKNGELKVIGVASVVANIKKNRAKQCQDIVVHTSVSYFKNWINDNMLKLLAAKNSEKTSEEFK